MNLPVRSDLRGVAPYGALQLEVPVRLNSNESPYPLPQVVTEALAVAVCETAPALNRYPDAECTELRAAVAKYLATESQVKLEIANIWAGNGSNEVMSDLFAAFGGPGHTAMTFSPSYMMYPEYCRTSSTRFVEVPRNANFEIDLAVARAAIAAERPALVVVASPNNPTGTATSIETLRQLACITKGAGPDGDDSLLVVDEAYGEFRRAGIPSALTLLADYEHVVVTRTMSKAFGYAGARIGYAAAHQEVIDLLRIVHLPYHLSAISQAVALTGLAHVEVLGRHVAALRAERDRTVSRLRAAGFVALDSDANFVSFGLFQDRHAIWQGLLAEGVLVREAGPSPYLRVTIGTAEDMDTFFTALRKVTA